MFGDATQHLGMTDAFYLTWFFEGNRLCYHFNVYAKNVWTLSFQKSSSQNLKNRSSFCLLVNVECYHFWPFNSFTCTSSWPKFLLELGRPITFNIIWLLEREKNGKPVSNQLLSLSHVTDSSSITTLKVALLLAFFNCVF